MEGAVRAFDTWMSSDAGVWVLLTLVLLSPLITLIHELGHAVVGLLGMQGPIRVRVGRTPPQWQGTFGRIHLDMSLLPARNAPAGLARVSRVSSRLWRVVFVLAGPLAQAMAGAAILATGVVVGVSTLSVTGALVVVAALVNHVPFEHHGIRSDGAQLAEILKR